MATLGQASGLGFAKPGICECLRTTCSVPTQRRNSHTVSVKASLVNSEPLSAASLSFVREAEPLSQNRSLLGFTTEESVSVASRGEGLSTAGPSADAFPMQGGRKCPTLVLMRHGESMWNDLKLFTGDVDIPLTERGAVEAMAGGRSVGETDFDMIFTSRLVRSKQTALLAMTQNQHKAVPVIVRGGYYGKGKTGDENRLRLREAAAQALRQAKCRMIPVYADPALNERCYGDLQGMNKEAAAEEFGKELVQKWRRSHDTRPPSGESLLDTYNRSVDFFLSTIEPRLTEGHNVLVVSHGNVLRCIMSHICKLSEKEMLRLQIMTALPYAFVFNGPSTYAQCCVLPPVDPLTNKPITNVPQGIASVLRSGEVDSLI